MTQLSICLSFAAAKAVLSVAPSSKPIKSATGIEVTLHMQVKENAAAIDNSSQDLQKHAAAINDLAHKVINHLISFSSGSKLSSNQQHNYDSMQPVLLPTAFALPM